MGEVKMGKRRHLSARTTSYSRSEQAIFKFSVDQISLEGKEKELPSLFFNIELSVQAGWYSQ
jgi:hypothetical protein